MQTLENLQEANEDCGEAKPPVSSQAQHDTQHDAPSEIIPGDRQKAIELGREYWPELLQANGDLWPMKTVRHLDRSNTIYL